MVEVFKTNVSEIGDCDKTLKIETSESVDFANIIFKLKHYGLQGEILPD